MAWSIWQGLSEGDHCQCVRSEAGGRRQAANLASCTVTSYCTLGGGGGGQKGVKKKQEYQG